MSAFFLSMGSLRKTLILAAGLGLVLSVSSTEVAAEQESATTPEVSPAPLPTDPPTYQEALDSLGVVGYPSALSVEPGETVDIMVSTQNRNFTADLVRISHGDADPKGPGIIEEVIASPSNKEYKGQHQPLTLGSYVAVPSNDALTLDDDFTITAWIAPTTIPGSDLNPLAQERTPVGTPRPQGILAKWDEDAKNGYGLFIAEDGGLALKVADGSGEIAEVSTGIAMNPYTPSIPLRATEADNSIRPMMTGYTNWYFVAATFEADCNKVTLYQHQMRRLPDSTSTVVSETVDVAPASNPASLLIGAGWIDETANVESREALFNGKIDNPRIYARALSADEIFVLESDGSVNSGLVAHWDFSQSIEGSDVVDIAGVNDGVTHNLPVRGVTGHKWQDGTMDFKDNPEMYSALYFHEDDLGDTGWDTSVSFTIPEDAKSGFYGARLTADDNIYHATFTVRPKAGDDSADIAFMVPTFSYLAYGSSGASFKYSASQYAGHNDGSGVFYSSSLRPLIDVRPYATGMEGEGKPWQFEADTHITDWLESTGQEIAYITDHDVHREGAALLNKYKVVVSGSHPEYISEQIWNALETYFNDGGRFMYMGGNGYYWVTSLSDDGTYTELRRHDGTEAWQAPPGEYYHSTTGEFGGLWRFRGYAPQELVGVGFSAQGFSSFAGSGDYGRPYEVTEEGIGEGGSWVFEDVDTSGPIGDFPTLQNEGGPGGEELDRVEYSLGTPANTLVLAVSNGFGDEYVHVVEEVNTSNLMQGGTVNPLVRADMALMYYPNGGAVWSSSSISWAGSLFYNDYDNDVEQITRNVLDKFASGEPLPAAPSMAE